jgi:hypothetical protein
VDRVKEGTRIESEVKELGEKRKYHTSSSETDTVVPLVSHFELCTVKWVLHTKYRRSCSALQNHTAVDCFLIMLVCYFF